MSSGARGTPRENSVQNSASNTDSVSVGSVLGDGEDADVIDVIVGPLPDAIELATARSCGDGTAEMRPAGAMSGLMITTVIALGTGSDHNIRSLPLLQTFMHYTPR